jgi:hypothetical protein
MQERPFLTGDQAQPEKDDAREAVKAIIRLYLDDGTPEEEIMALVGPAATRNWRIQINGSIIDQGELLSLSRQVAAIGQGRIYWEIFDMAEVIAELRQEAGNKEPPENAPRCLFCGAVLDNQPKGRDRLYCDNKNKCKQAHHRKQQQEKRRAAILEQHPALREMWEASHISGELLEVLQDLLINQGEEKAQAATTAIIVYAQQERTPQQPGAAEHRPRRTKRNQ